MATSLRGIFDEDPELYDRARPRYPDDLVAELTARAGIGPGTRVLEIAPGTGQLTLPLARTGCDLTAVELGAGMAEVARRNLADHPNARVQTADFETWPLPERPFDAVAVATAFHWLSAEAKFARTAEALRPGGVLAVVSNNHVAGGTPEFFARVQPLYERWDPKTTPGFVLPEAESYPPPTAEIDASGRFEPAAYWRTVQDVPYTTAEYLDVLRTYSGHRALTEEARTRLLGEIAELIDVRFGGRIVKRYLRHLVTAVRRP